MENIFAVYKPKGPTSHDIVDELRKITGIQKIGHAGTLDPLAEGVLVVGIGREATKKLNEIVAKEKEYEANIFLGEESSTDDAEGEKIGHEIQKIPSREEIKNILKSFLGVIEQVPPQFSAVKIGGKTAYSIARKGKTITLKPRKVEIKNIQIRKYEFPHLDIGVTCGPGAYIRALARDIGKKLNTGAYLSGLVRTRVGQYTAENSTTLLQFQKSFKNKK